MSNALAIATVTTALAEVVRSAAQSAVPGAEVLTERPDHQAAQHARVRLFLYQVTPNACLRNRDLPARKADGNLMSRPVAALDLHYLISFYGNENELEPQRMLGAVARDLHAKPALMRKAISDAIASQGFLNGSNLADAMEQVKFTPATLTLDEIGKIWSIFFQTPYALSLGYQATAVLIDAEEGAPAARPVLTRGEGDQGVDTRLGPFPALDGLHIGEPAKDNELDIDRLRRPSYPSARVGAIVTLRGHNFSGDSVRVRFFHPRLSSPDPRTGKVKAKEIIIPEEDRTTTQIRVVIRLDPPVPADPEPQPDWAAGIYEVTVVVQRGENDLTSNALPLPFAPRITRIEPPNPVQRVPSTDPSKIDATLTLTFEPKILLSQATTPVAEVQIIQRAVLLVLDREVSGQLTPMPLPLPTTTDKKNFVTDALKFIVKDVPVASNALVRLRIDNVDSLTFTLSDKSQPALDKTQLVTLQ